MRVLFALFVSSFFFLTSTGREKAVDVGFDKGAAITSQFSKGYFGEGLQSIRHTNTVLFRGSNKTGKQARLHLGLFTIGRPAVLPTVASSYHQRQVAPKYSYCTPIALKLLFPKHYFW